ncbi:MAG: Thermophilic metalloprotease (M29) superfamily [uncultured bacterium (gcode 4)]|uniref:Thermophilic metalloprotease (M29) superfamily n=1 Tax=uncultured bacterium (gcode 4) TaxID=1234023 RepID=K2AX82_9BACT|nr:MAG: Thermophilic metalloprotease (M29) superfamily [uncultured bacterium (gcode 4)]
MYIPNQEILKKYADVLIKFALWWGEWIKKWDVVYLQVPESAKHLLVELQKSVLEAGGNYIVNYLPEWTQRNFFEMADEDQLNFWPKNYMMELINTCDHFVRIESSWDKFELAGIDSKKLISRQKILKPYMDARNKKENDWKLTWTIGLYGTEAMVQDAWLTIEEYWEEIIKSCFLDEIDPIAKWKEVFSEIEAIRQKLNKLKIQKVKVTGTDVDLEVLIWEKRQWLGGSGRNIPSFEIFTSPDWRGTNGWIKFNQPLYRYGNKIEWIELEFKDWIIIKSKASSWENLLKEMLAAEWADKIWEFSLTDRRFSRITKFMWETLYDENVGWEFWNTHIAVGASYHEAFDWNMATQTPEDWENLGFNESAIHTDIMSTTNRTVEATLENWEKLIIYKDWEFRI